MNAKKVTISIPIFKCENFIIKTLESVVAQTYPNIEVVLVNDKTPDNSAILVSNFIEEYQLSNWRLVELSENSGLSVVRNKGIDEATGEYIFFLDSDDTLVPTAISDFVERAEETNAEVVVGEVRGIKLPENEEVDVFPLLVKEDLLEGNNVILKCLVDGGFPVSSWNKLIRVDFLKENKIYFTKGLYAQDSLHTFEMALKLNKIAFLRKKTYDYYLHSDSVIHNRKKVHFDNWITIANKLNDYCVAEKNEARRLQILKYLLTFKSATLLMNWKAQKNEELWKYSYDAYSKLEGLRVSDYFSSAFSSKEKKDNFYMSLPTNLGYKLFRRRFGN
ncbi:glycosyltransferase [Soonwooa sp.]|uniref:glycosyltransferase n=1 Tax=Soonwooa sp. TaxID=1938592 RepID=UPI0026115AB7|nr:glycosyltransferase [Soonwooa sp.]